MALAHPVSVCVFCGSGDGLQVHRNAASELGKMLAESNVSVTYGGGNIGLMGLLADAALHNGGRVVGVIPQFLIDLEVAHHGLTELIVVDSMHERKAEMASRADAFIALPGGFGTLEEFFEVLTWLQLGLHRKPCIIYNVDHFYTPLLDFLNASHKAGLISSASMRLITVCSSLDEVMAIVKGLRPEPSFREDRS